MNAEEAAQVLERIKYLIVVRAKWPLPNGFSTFEAVKAARGMDWFEEMGRWPFDTAMLALERASGCKWLPTTAELRDLVAHELGNANRQFNEAAQLRWFAKMALKGEAQRAAIRARDKREAQLPAPTSAPINRAAPSSKALPSPDWYDPARMRQVQAETAAMRQARAAVAPKSEGHDRKTEEEEQS